MITFMTAAVIVLINVMMYYIVLRITKRLRLPTVLPVLVTTTIIVVFLLVFRISYQTYMIGGNWINQLLGPAVVALAYPLYKQRKLLQRHVLSIMGGAITGMMVGMVSGVVLAKALGFSKQYIFSLLPKSITTPVAMQISDHLGGDASLAAIFVMVAGYTGAIGGPAILKWFKVSNPIGCGIGLGSASHALGTAKSMEFGELSVSVSSVAMTISAIVGSFAGPAVAWFVYF